MEGERELGPREEKKTTSGETTVPTVVLVGFSLTPGSLERREELLCEKSFSRGAGLCDSHLAVPM